MYCQKCGKKIEDNSIYCNQCGWKIDSKFTQEDMEARQILDRGAKKDTEHCCGGFFVFMAIFLIFALIAILLSDLKCEGKLFEQKATARDISFDSELNLSSMSVDVILIPECDIQDLEIKLTYYDSKGNCLTTDTKVVGNVYKGIQRNVKIYLTDFSLSTALKINEVKITITEGVKSIFG